MAENTAASMKAVKLGAALRQERDATGTALRKFAPQVGMSPAHLSRIENGHALPTRDTVGRILAKLDVNGDRYSEIVGMLDGADAPQWVATGIADQALQSAAMVEFEANAATIYEVATLLFPGLLQVASYARAIMSRGTVPRGEVATRVATRMGRRDVIDPARTANPAHFTAILDEAVLQRVIGSPAVMVEQLEHLLKVAAWDHADVRVLRLADADWHPGLSGPFSLIEPRGDGFPIVSIGSRRASLILHSDEDVAEYRESVDAVLRAALSQADTTDLIAAAIEEMRRT